MSIAYRIAGWSANFEKNRTRDIKQMHWVPMPTKHDGDGYTELLDHPSGPAHFGAWCALVQVAAKCDPRGTLLREGRMNLRRPHDAASLSRIIRFPESVLVEAIGRLMSIGWLEAISMETGELIESPQEGAGIPQEPAVMSQEGAAKSQEPAVPSRERGRERRGEKRREENNRGEKDSCGETVPVSPPAPPVIVFPVDGVKGGPSEWGLTQAKLSEFEVAFPSLNVLGEFRKALLWLANNPTQRKTASGMGKFLQSWLERSQNRPGQRSGTVSQMRGANVDPGTLEKAKGSARTWPMGDKVEVKP